MSKQDFPIFNFSVASVSIVESKNELTVSMALSIFGPDNAQLADLITHHKLVIGMKIFDMVAGQVPDAEKRGVLAGNATTDNGVFAKFSVTPMDFAKRQSLLGKIDFLYEGEYWFDSLRESNFYLAIANPFSTEPHRDIFEHYRSKVTGES